MVIVHEGLLIKKEIAQGTVLTTTKQHDMFKVRNVLNILTVILGAAYLIADANEMDYDYAWDHSIYPPFTGKQNINFSLLNTLMFYS